MPLPGSPSLRRWPRRLRGLLALCAAVGLAAIPPAPGTERGIPFHRVFGPEAWGGGAMVYTAVRDSRGVLYFGTDEAVVEYDGVTWRRIETPNHTAVRALAVGPDGALYAGCTSEFGVLEPDGSGGRRYRSLARDLPPGAPGSGSVWGIHVAREGVYFQSPDWLLLRRPDGSFASWRAGRSFHKSFLLEGELFLREVGRGLLVLRQGQLQLLTSTFATDGIYFMLPWGPRKALVGGNKTGLHVVDLQDGTVSRPVGFEALSDELARDQLFHGVALPSGRLAFSTLLGGVVLAERSGRVVERLRSPRIPLRGEFAHALLADGDNLWLTQNNGIAYLETGSPFRYWDRSGGFRGTAYGAERHQGRLYFASGLAVFSPEGEALQEVMPRMPAWAILRFRPLRGPERLLIGTINGIYELAGGAPKLLTSLDSSGNVFGLYQDPGTDTVWASTRQGLARLSWTGTRWVEEGYHPGLQEEVRSVFRAPDGDLWVARLYGGVARVRGSEVARLGAPEGLPVEGGVTVASHGGQPLFLTRKGIHRFDPARGRFLPEPRFGAGLADGSTAVKLFVPGPQGEIWLATSEGGVQRVERLLPDGTGFVRETRPFARLPLMPLENLYPEADGTVWIGGKEGIFRLETGGLPLPGTPPPTLLRRFTVNGGPTAFGAPPEVPFTRSALTFEWACPYPQGPRPMQFRWRLEGYDEAWSGWSTETHRELSRLPEGRYVFRVEGRTYDGAPSAGASQAFTILPPWHRTLPARALFLALLGGGVWAVVRLNVARLTREKARLEQVVAARTRDLAAANAELARSQEKLAEFMAVAPDLLEDLEAWVRRMVQEMLAFEGLRGVAALAFTDSELRVHGSTLPDLPSLSRLVEIRTPTLTGSRLFLPARGPSGDGLGLVVVEGEGLEASGPLRHLVEGFAHQFGVALDMLRVRSRLHVAEATQAKTLEEYHAKGIATLQVCTRCGRCYDHTATICARDGGRLEVPRAMPYRFLGRYRFLRRVGLGGMGAVFSAEDESLSRRVAIKLIRPEFVSETAFRLRFEREAQAIAKVQHPGVVTLHDSGSTPDGQLYLIMEHLKGLPVATMLRQYGRANPVQVARFLRQGARALQAAHEAGVVHRDLKPANLFLVPQAEEGFQLKILDFGLAQSESFGGSLTRTGAALGTPQYMAPEQILSHPTGPRTDLYAFAAVAYEVLTRKPVVSESEVSAFLRGTLKVEVRPPSTLVPALPSAVDAAFAAALAWEAEDRPSDLIAWADGLAALLEGVRVPGGWPEVVPREPKTGAAKAVPKAPEPPSPTRAEGTPQEDPTRGL